MGGTSDMMISHGNHIQIMCGRNTSRKQSDFFAPFLPLHGREWNGIHQLGQPRIGVFAEKVRPDPLHCDINAWHNVSGIIYIESVQRVLFHKFMKILSAPVGTEDHEQL